MDLQQRLAQRREQQHPQQAQSMKKAPAEEVRFPGQQFDSATIAHDRLYEEQFNGFKQANGQYPKEGELDKWVAQQQNAKDQPQAKVADPTFDKALSVNMDRQENGKPHIEMPKLMDALDRVSKQRQDESQKIDINPEISAKAPRLSK